MGAGAALDDSIAVGDGALEDEAALVGAVVSLDDPDPAPEPQADTHTRTGTTSAIRRRMTAWYFRVTSTLAP